MTLTIELTQDQIDQLTGQQVGDVTVAYKASKRAEKPIIDTAALAAGEFADLGNKAKEHFAIITLDAGNRLIAKRVISIGTLTSSLVHPREVFVDAITDRAASVILAHNHPSGGLRASGADVEVTRRLKDVGELIGIQVIDHIIVTADGHASMKEAGAF